MLSSMLVIDMSDKSYIPNTDNKNNTIPSTFAFTSFCIFISSFIYS